MGVWFLMLGCNLLIPAIMLIAGGLFMKSAPRKINRILGYRSTMSMKNQDTWQFAHAVAGKFWFRWGWVDLVIAVVPMLLVLNRSEYLITAVDLVVMFVLLIPLLAVIPYTEKALRDTFDTDGKRRECNAD